MKSIIYYADYCLFDAWKDFNKKFNSKSSVYDFIDLVSKRLNDEILPKIIEAAGKENVFEFETDLTSLDGLKTHGIMKSKISVPSLDFYRSNIEIFDKYKIGKWWWLGTPDTTIEHRNNNWVLCVSPYGDIHGDNYGYDSGVRPILFLNSSILVSCEG